MFNCWSMIELNYQLVLRLRSRDLVVLDEHWRSHSQRTSSVRAQRTLKDYYYTYLGVVVVKIRSVVAPAVAKNRSVVALAD